MKSQIAIQLLHTVKDEAVFIAVDRHTNLLVSISKAIEAAIIETDAAEARQGFDPMSETELAGVMGNVVGDVLGSRGISRKQFGTVLGVSVWGEAELTPQTPAGGAA